MSEGDNMLEIGEYTGKLGAKEILYGVVQINFLKYFDNETTPIICILTVIYIF